MDQTKHNASPKGQATRVRFEATSERKERKRASDTARRRARGAPARSAPVSEVVKAERLAKVKLKAKIQKRLYLSTPTGKAGQARCVAKCVAKRRATDPRFREIGRARGIVSGALNGADKTAASLEALGFGAWEDEELWERRQHPIDHVGHWHHRIALHAKNGDGEYFWDPFNPAHQLMMNHHLNLQWMDEEAHKAHHKAHGQDLPEDWQEIMARIEAALTEAEIDRRIA